MFKKYFKFFSAIKYKHKSSTPQTNLASMIACHFKVLRMSPGEGELNKNVLEVRARCSPCGWIPSESTEGGSIGLPTCSNAISASHGSRRGEVTPFTPF